MTVPTTAQPPEEQWDDLLFAWKVCRHVRSNAIVFAKGGATVGIGAGQMSRVDSVRIAVDKAGEAFGDRAEEMLAGSVVASDAFFPFADGPQGAIEAGRDGGDPARWLEARRRGDRRLRRRRRRDGLHRAAATSATRRVSRAHRVLRVFCAADGTRRKSARRLLRRRRGAGGSARQAVALDLGYSETVFVDDPERGGDAHLHAGGRAAARRAIRSSGTAWLLRERGFEVPMLRPPAGECAGAVRRRPRPSHGEPGVGTALGLRPAGLAGGRSTRSPGRLMAMSGSGRGRGSTRTPGSCASASSSPRPGSTRTRRPARRRCACTRTARPRDRDPPGQGLGALRAPAGDDRAEVGGRVVLDEVRDYPLG